MTENVSNYKNYDGVHFNHVLDKEGLIKIIEDDAELLQQFKNQSKKKKHLKEYLIKCLEHNN